MAASDRKTDTFDLLERDHEAITRSLDSISEKTGAERENLILELHDLMGDHLTLEEDFVYPVLEDYEELGDGIAASVGEHAEIRELLDEVVDLETGSFEWDGAFMALREIKAGHMAMERQEIFPLARRIMGEEGISRLDELVARGRGLPMPPPLRKKQPREPQLGI